MLARALRFKVLGTVFGIAMTLTTQVLHAENKNPTAAAKNAVSKEVPAKDVKAAKPVDKQAEKAKTAASASPTVVLETNLGKITIALDEKKAPVTVKNFLGYVADKFYDGTVFHRVIDGFMIQGGGFEVAAGKLNEKKTKAPITNEGQNNLRNDRGTIAMARTGDPNSATAQFFINLVNNDSLNYPKPDGHGYAVFGKVTSGMEVVDKIGKSATTLKDGMGDVPAAEVRIISATLEGPKAH